MKHYHVYLPHWRVRTFGSPDVEARRGSAPLGFEIVRQKWEIGMLPATTPVRAWRTRSAAGRWARRQHGLAITHQCDSPDCAPI